MVQLIEPVVGILYQNKKAHPIGWTFFFWWTITLFIWSGASHRLWTRFSAEKPRLLAGVHRTPAKSRLSSPFWLFCLQNSIVRVLTSFRDLSEVVGQNGLEPSTSRLSVVCSSQLSYWPVSTSFGGEYRDRTGDLLLARQALSQLS